ncbi:MAG TPA: hypothetical protein VF511_08775 [Chthoniobacterales bacterium]
MRAAGTITGLTVGAMDITSAFVLAIGLPTPLLVRPLSGATAP